MKNALVAFVQARGAAILKLGRKIPSAAGE